MKLTYLHKVSINVIFHVCSYIIQMYIDGNKNLLSVENLKLTCKF